MLKGVCALMNLKDIIKITKVGQIKFSPVDLDKSDIGGGIYRMYDANEHVIYVGKLWTFIGDCINMQVKIRIRPILSTRLEDTNGRLNLTLFSKICVEAIFIAYHRPKYNDEVKDSEKKLGEENDSSRQ